MLVSEWERKCFLNNTNTLKILIKLLSNLLWLNQWLGNLKMFVSGTLMQYDFAKSSPDPNTQAAVFCRISCCGGLFCIDYESMRSAGFCSDYSSTRPVLICFAFLINLICSSVGVFKFPK